MKALVLCGTMSQVHLIKEMKRRGIEIVLADLNKFAPAVKYVDKFYSVSTLDVDGIREVAIKEKVDFIII